MNKNKFYRVVEKTDRNGDTIFEVQAAECKIDVLFNTWSIYEKKNKSLNEAIKHIKNLHGWSMKSKKVVYKTDINKL